ncbi:TetR/AcrR family transcriptional regulator [Leifsonia aquatica]|uniref:Transcriptional regulator, TetR family n=2 Tax=Leifsonia aquatica TaxID=144185 RepID=U2T2F8_LEIAQ|nr:TetR/AcrR family transcriptional regulator [Leifsonia aquatica]ERK71668.1 transcriptional regulator, TetR family [Leifsonia aquatica ATCC 14665]MBB2967180.1 AcrR family transcriptional regulator [Leifsonia aquatica]
MSTDRRTRLTPDERRAQLVALGVAFLAESPLDELTIDTLSERAGVSRGLLFHYFGSKQGLHREVVRTARDSMLHATEPIPELPPLDRLHDTLVRIVRFVREHGGTFYSLVRGVASGDSEVRAVVEEAREEQAVRVVAAFLELGVPDTPLLRIALRSWVAFAEEALVESALGTDLSADEIVAFLERSVRAVVAALDATSG